MQVIFNILLLLFLINISTTKSQKISVDYAEKIGKKFIEKQYYKYFLEKKEFITKEIIPYSYDGDTVFYIITFKDSGFVIISNSKKAFPIMGYSYQDRIIIDSLPCCLRDYLDKAGRQVLFSLSNKDVGYENVWERILKEELDTLNKQKYNEKGVLPMVKLYWGQGYPYNMYCPAHPSGPGGHCVTGCVATAMAMVMKYHNYPENGNSYKVFLWSEPDTINFENTYYEWYKMTPWINSNSASAIALLMFHCGVSVDMNYGPQASASLSEFIPNALKTYFRYHPSIRIKYRRNFFSDEWDMLIRDELNYKRPVIYSGSGVGGGHAFVCDGYQDTCFYHFNWGWNGNANGYYYYNDLTPNNYDFSYDQKAVVFIQPYYRFYCTENFIYTDTARFIEDGSGVNYYWSNTNCSWLIKPRNNKKIKLEFISFETENGKDFLYIYDGENENAPLIGAFSGNISITPIISSSNSLFLKFITDSSNQYQGWKAYYTTHFNYSITLKSEPLIIFNKQNNNLFIKTNDSEIYFITIYDLQGKILYSTSFKNVLNISTINFSPFFIIKILSNNQGLYIRKFVNTN